MEGQVSSCGADDRRVDGASKGESGACDDGAWLSFPDLAPIKLEDGHFAGGGCDPSRREPSWRP